MASKNDFLSKLRALDAYPKINEDFFTKTMSGGIITIVASVVMGILFITELRLFFMTNTVHELSVDTSRGETITINIDINFPKMPCSWISLDAMDVSGDLHLDVDHDVYKQRLSAAGQPVSTAEKHEIEETKKDNETILAVPGNDTCLSCYGAEDFEGQCCNTCEKVREQYTKRGWALMTLGTIVQCKDDHYYQSIKEQQGEGCHMWGKLEVNKVAGNFHFAPGKSYQQGSMHVHDLAPFLGLDLDFTHTLNKLSFGKEYPGMRNPLDGQKSSQTTPGGMYQYFLKVVPTSYTDLRNHTTATNQYSVTENYRPSVGETGRSLPGLFFFYDLSPIKVQIQKQRNSFLHFLTNVCAIVGGIFTVSGIIDACIYHGDKIIRKKMELGKFS